MKRHSDSTNGNSLGSRPRCGFTLIEMLIVITVFVFLLASAAMAISTLLRAQGDLQMELIEAATMSRLAAQLRSDAHLANSVGVVTEGSTTTTRLRLPDAEIHYTTLPQRIIRTEHREDAEVHREVFALLEGTTANWEVSTKQPTFITLTISFVSPNLRESVAMPHAPHHNER